MHLLYRPATVTGSLWLSTMLWFLSRFAKSTRNEHGHLLDMLHNVGLIMALGCLIAGLDRLIVYPWLRNPLRKAFPVIFTNHLTTTHQLLTENTRGKMALEWIREHPDADALHTHGIFERSVVYPVSPRALRDALATNCYDYVKPRTFSRLLVHIAGSGLIFTEGEKYRRQRKIVYPQMSPSNVNKLYPIVWKKSQMLTGHLSKLASTGQPLDISPYLFRYVLDSTCLSLISYDLDSLGSRWNDRNVMRLEKSMTPRHQATVFAMCAFLIPDWLFSALPARVNSSIPRQGQNLRSFCWYMLGIIREQNRWSPPSSTEPFKNLVESGSLQDQEIVEVMLNFLIAGIETTSSALLWTLHLLSLPENMHWQEKLRMEARAMMTGEQLDHATIGNLPLLNGVLEEVLRLHPPIPVTWRETTGESTIAGKLIPKNTHVAIDIYAINRHPKYWGETADVFDPLRWLHQDEQGAYHFQRSGASDSFYNMMTFLNGPRSCIGKDFAKVSIRLALFDIFQRFHISQQAQDGEEPLTCGLIVTRPRSGPILKFVEVG